MKIIAWLKIEGFKILLCISAMSELFFKFILSLNFNNFFKFILSLNYAMFKLYLNIF